jgi:Protein of unknown function (DUF3078)
MKKLVFTLTLAMASGFTFAQDAAKEAPKDGWTKSTQFGINLAGAGFNSNWKSKQGGFNNTALGFLLNAKADMLKGKGTWSNDLQMQYGMVRGEFADSKKETRKAVDRLFFDSKYARKISGNLNWFTGVNFLTQFAEGLDYTKNKQIISNIFAPAVLTEGIGLEYKPVPYLVLQFGGATLRQTFVNNNAVAKNVAGNNKSNGAFGVNVLENGQLISGPKYSNDLGFNITTAFDKDIVKNVNLKVRYAGFKVLAQSNATKAYKETAAYKTHLKLDNRVDAIATAKINKYLNVNGTLILIQDKDIITGWQRSNGFNVGLLYTL